MGKIAICILLLFVLFFGIFALWNMIVCIYEFFCKIPYKTRLIKTPEGTYRIEDKQTIISLWKTSKNLGCIDDMDAIIKFRKHIEESRTIRKNIIICEQKINNTK